MSEEKTEQITKEPVNQVKIKDPYRVKAGKKLSADNKKARQALKREEEREAKARQEEKDEGASIDINTWIPSLSFQNVLTLGSIEFAAYALFTSYKNKIADLHLPPPTFNPRPVKNIDETMRVAAQENNLKDGWMAENKLVKTVTHSAVLVGLAAAVGYVGKKALKESFIGDPSSSIMNYGKWVAVLAASMYLKTYLEDTRRYYPVADGEYSDHAWWGITQ